MSSILPLAPVDFTRRGACPSLDEPMQTGDGLLARLRLPHGRLMPRQLAAIAQLAGQHGNGLIEITARGNLQVRGLSEGTHRLFAEAVRQITPIDDGLVVETPPLAGEVPHERADPRPLAAALRQLARPFAGRIGPKVAIVVDGGGQIGLAALKADIRLTAFGQGQWALAVGNGAAETVSDAVALDSVARVLGQLAALGPGARATDLAAHATRPAPSAGQAPIGVFALHTGQARGLALPFGSTDTQSIAALCELAHQHGITDFRLAPQHGLLAVGASAAFVQAAAALGFITAPADPRLRISACIGSQGCAAGHIPARVLAARLAPNLPPGLNLHISGCAKGCAHPRRADVTLVGRPDGYGLVNAGTAGDMPQALLQLDQLESVLAAR